MPPKPAAQLVRSGLPVRAPEPLEGPRLESKLRMTSETRRVCAKRWGTWPPDAEGVRQQIWDAFDYARCAPVNPGHEFRLIRLLFGRLAAFDRYVAREGDARSAEALAKAREILEKWSRRNRDDPKCRAHFRATRARDKKFTSAEWRQVKEKWSKQCLRCKRAEPEIRLQADHVKPLCHGGSGTIENIQPLCGPCNNWKGMATIDFRS